MFYAGIGSRTTPPEMLEYMARLAERLAARGFVLRSGAADGADAAFEQGCVRAGGLAEIWLPWKKFNGHADTGLYPLDYHFEIAKVHHPNWAALRHPVRCLHARNVGQVLGQDGSAPSSFVVCWTPDGCESRAERSSKTGGTGQAIAIADAHGVDVFNLGKVGSMERLYARVLQLVEAEAGAGAPERPAG